MSISTIEAAKTIAAAVWQYNNQTSVLERRLEADKETLSRKDYYLGEAKRDLAEATRRLRACKNDTSKYAVPKRERAEAAIQRAEEDVARYKHLSMESIENKNKNMASENVARLAAVIKWVALNSDLFVAEPLPPAVQKVIGNEVSPVLVEKYLSRWKECISSYDEHPCRAASDMWGSASAPDANLLCRAMYKQFYDSSDGSDKEYPEVDRGKGYGGHHD